MADKITTDAAAAAQSVATDVRTESRGLIASHPYTSVLVALGVGIVLGVVLALAA